MSTFPDTAPDKDPLEGAPVLVYDFGGGKASATTSTAAAPETTPAVCHPLRVVIIACPGQRPELYDTCRVRTRSIRRLAR
jgi:hypothetical protein